MTRRGRMRQRKPRVEGNEASLEAEARNEHGHGRNLDGGRAETKELGESAKGCGAGDRHRPDEDGGDEEHGNVTLDEVVESRLEHLRVVVFKYYGKEGANGHHLPAEQEDNEVVGKEEYEQARQCEQERQPMEDLLNPRRLIMTEVAAAIECAKGKGAANNDAEPCGERVAGEAHMPKHGVREVGKASDAPNGWDGHTKADKGEGDDKGCSPVLWGYGFRKNSEDDAKADDGKGEIKW